MIGLLTLLFITIIIIIGGCFVASLITWITHIIMVKDEHKPYDWCTFKTFIKEFDKYKDHNGLDIDGHSIFLYRYLIEKTVYLHANIVRFGDRCMMLYPHSWIRYCIWKYNFTKTRKEKYRQKGLWK